MRSATVFGLAIFAAISTPALSQADAQIEKRYSKDYRSCIASTDNVESDILGCTELETDRQDARLNQAYKMVMMRLTTGPKTKLRGLQRAWIKQTDAKCERASAQEASGTLAALAKNKCILRETVRRTIFLEAYKG